MMIQILCPNLFTLYPEIQVPCEDTTVTVPRLPGCGASARRAAGGRLAERDGRSLSAQLLLGGLDKEMASVEFDVDTILGYDRLRAHGFNFLYDESDAVCLCAERGCTSGRRYRLNLTFDAPASPALCRSPAETLTPPGPSAPMISRRSAVRSPGGGAALPLPCSPRLPCRQG